MRKESKPIDLAFRDECIAKLQDYGPIEKSRDFDIQIEGKNRKYIKIISDATALDLVDVLSTKTGYRFFFFDDGAFYGRAALGTMWKKEIFYDSKELHLPSFCLDLLHEAGHFPLRYDEDAVEIEKDAWRKAIAMAIALKKEYNFCALAGFGSADQVYMHIHTCLSTYY